MSSISNCLSSISKKSCIRDVMTGSCSRVLGAGARSSSQNVSLNSRPSRLNSNWRPKTRCHFEFNLTFFENSFNTANSSWNYLRMNWRFLRTFSRFLSSNCKLYYKCRSRLLGPPTTCMFSGLNHTRHINSHVKLWYKTDHTTCVSHLFTHLSLMSLSCAPIWVVTLNFTTGAI